MKKCAIKQKNIFHDVSLKNYFFVNYQVNLIISNYIFYLTRLLHILNITIFLEYIHNIYISLHLFE